jgi:C-terminal processing protease CtpA/Prc
MQLPMTKARLGRDDAAARAGVALILAAALATSSVHAAENVERDDTAASRAEADAQAKAERARDQAEAKRDKAERDREAAKRRTEKAELDAKLADAQRRLEKAASEVAQLSQQIATRVVENMNWSFPGTRRTVIGVQLEAGTSGGGAKVQEVSPGGPAEQAGIRPGDVVVAVNGTEVKGDNAAREVVSLLRGVAPDTKVKVRVLRDGKPRDFEVTARPFDPRTFVYRTDPPPGFGPAPHVAPNPNPFDGWFGPSSLASDLQGMECTTLTPQLGKYFGADKGVLIVRAPRNSETLKLQDGDVILNVDGREPNNGSHLTRILRSYQPGEKLVMRIMRDRKPIEMEVTVPESRSSRRARAAYLPYGVQPTPQGRQERQGRQEIPQGAREL